MSSRSDDYPIPLPGPGVDWELLIPVDLLEEFKVKPRILIRYPWVVGIPIPELLRELRPDLLEKLEKAEMDVMLVPRQGIR
jgi:hypothetical protein